MKPSRFAFLFLVVILAGCRPAAPTIQATQPVVEPEVLWEYWPDGTPKTYKEVARGPNGAPVENGRSTTWFQSGLKQYEATYINGKIHGLATAWHPNGCVWTTEEYADGLRHGTRTAWDQDGHRVQEEHYYNDLPDGTWTIWKTDGEIKWQARFDKGTPLP
jgi:antitoxin component YwqK of YwqJK toxin-antitoxin module